MKILFSFYNDNPNSGGAEGVLMQMADFYLKKGAELYILFLKEKSCCFWDQLECDNLHLYYCGGLIGSIENVKKLHKISFDYSFSSLVRLTGTIGMLKRMGILSIKTMVGRESTSIFVRYHGLKLKYYQMWYWLGYKAVDVLICQTHFMKQQLLMHQPWLEKRTKVVVIPNPVNIDQMMSKALEKIEVDKIRPYIVTAGRFIAEKAYDILLDAFAIVAKNRPELRLVFLGDGVLRDKMEEQTKRLGIRNKVILQGYVDNVYPWFKQAELCVVSSRLEGFPNVLLQMMSQNERVVSTLCAGGIDEIKGLVTCRPNDAKALAEALEISMSQKGNNNRLLFDCELKKRTIDKFINTIELL